MIPNPTAKRFSWLLLLLPVFSGYTFAGTIENYTFINEIDTPTQYTAPDHFWRCLNRECTQILKIPSYSNQELRKASLVVEEEKTLVISFKKLAVWLPQQSGWENSEIQTSVKSQRDALTKLDEIAKNLAIKNAMESVNRQLNLGLTKDELTEVMLEVGPNWQSLLWKDDTTTELDQRKRDKAGIGWDAPQCIVSSYYFRFDREKLQEAIEPAIVVTSFAPPDFSSEKYTSEGTYVASFEKSQKIPGNLSSKNKDNARKQAFQTLVREISEQAFKDALSHTNNSLSQPVSPEDVKHIIGDHDYREFAALHISKQTIRRGKFVEGRRDEFLDIKMSVSFSREKLKNLLAPPPIDTTFAGPEIDPANYDHVVRYQDEIPLASSSDDNQESTLQGIFEVALEKMRREAFDTAYREINNGLPERLTIDELTNYLATKMHLELAPNWTINQQYIARRGRTETLHLAINFHYNRASIADDLTFSSKTNFAAPKINPADFPSETTYVVKFEDEPFAIVSDGATNDAMRLAVYKKAIDELSKAAFKDAVIQVNKDQRNPQSNDVIGQFIQEHTKYLVHDEEQKNFQQYTQNYEIKNQALVRRGLNERLNLTVYFYFDRETLGNAFRPPLEIIPTRFADTESDLRALSNTVTLVVPFENLEETISQEIEDRDIAHRQTFDNAIDKYAREALRIAISKVNNDLEQRKTPTELEALIQAIGDDHRNYTRNREITDQAISRRGSSTKAEETLQLTMYFYFDRLVIRDLIEPALRVTTIELDEASLLDMDIPASDDQTFVAVFRDEETKLATDIENRDVAIKRAAKKAVESLKKVAFQQAADDIKHRLDQKTDDKEFDRAVAKASKNVQSYILEWKIIESTISKRSDYSTAAETLRFSVYFIVDKKDLQKDLIAGRGITDVGRKRTYVELYWNFPGKKERFPAEMIEETTKAIVENVQDHFLMKNYEIVEFERIQNDLIKLAQQVEAEGIAEDDISSQDKYDQLMSGINLRNISNWSTGKAKEGSRSQHEVGNEILAKYAELLISATINAIEENKQERTLTVRQTIKAKVYERGEWIVIGMSDGFSTKPTSGTPKINFIVELSKNLARKLATELEPKISHKLARRKIAEELITQGEREFTVVFEGLNKRQFSKIRRLLMKSNRWEYKATEVSNRLVRISFEGGIDKFVIGMEDMFDEAGEYVGIPDYKSNESKITFDASE